MGSLTPLQPLNPNQENHPTSSTSTSTSTSTPTPKQNPTSKIPYNYWQINAPPSSIYHPSHASFPSSSKECPPFLLRTVLPPKDLITISTPNHLYKLDTWPEVVQRVRENKLADFQRTPADMWRYLEFCYNIKQEWKGGVKDFILTRRLKWEWPGPVVAKGTGFYEGCEERGDVKILWNDWPYGIDERIVHLVVWTKFELEDDPATGDLTDEARGEIDEYVKMTFGGKVPEEHVSFCPSFSAVMLTVDCEWRLIMKNRSSGSRTGLTSSR